MDFSRIITRDLRIQWERVDMARVVREISESIRPLLKAQGLTATFDIGNEVAVSGDPVRLGPIVTNLLANAIKFRPVEESVPVC